MNKRMEFSYDELAIINIILNRQVIALHQLRQLQQAQQEAKCKRRSRYSVHPLWRSRDTEGEFILIKQMLLDNEEKFYGYFHMSRYCFATLLWKIEGQLVKKCMHRKAPIALEERLAVCLRYLVTGDSLKTISYSFRMGRATVYQIVKETCKVITGTLLPETIPTPSIEMWEKIKQ
ncbi:uncharacterized protein LOC143354957 [Halictus rubicundus]|uniref:uncharacterized protein LOC143354957 n=1 Tax=Halictus rubicundus TaxID=77578 RepID=UPI00403545CE